MDFDGGGAMIGLLATLAFAVPLAGGVVLFKLDERKADALMLSSFALAMLFQLWVAILYLLNHFGETLHRVYLRSTQFGEAYGIIIDPMSVLIGTVVAVAGFIFMFYGMEYMSERNIGHPGGKGRGLFYAWMALFEGATLGFIYSSTFLALLIFFELMGLACWGVVSYYHTPAGRRAGFKAFIIPNIGAMIGFYTAVYIGLTQLHDLSLFSLSKVSPNIKPWLFIALLFAGYTKSAQFPTYSWIPDAMEAPTPASAFLHGAAMVEMGVYLVARVLQFIGPLPTWVFYF
uniref:proton-conducting transporter transmembrane domain-containing protein n=1 Tax=Thermococcus sp. TaxID=35749 RepID=UPI00262FE2D0